MRPDGADAVAFCAEEFPRLAGALSLYLGDRAIAEELAQEALLKACRRWERVSQLESPGGWTWRVARNLAKSHLRRRRAERRARARLGGVRPPSLTTTVTPPRGSRSAAPWPTFPNASARSW